PPPPPQEPPGQTIARALAAHGNQWASGQIQDWIAEGELTYFTADHPEVTFDVTLSRKGNRRVQRLIKQQAGPVKEGANGTAQWLSAGAFTGPAAGNSLYFIEGQTVRSVESLLNYRNEGLALRANGRITGSQIVEAEDKDGRKTNFYVSDGTSTISTLEFVTGQSRDPFRQTSVPDVESYRFSDFRRIHGLLTPFRVERFINGFKTEEMQFNSVSYNTSIKDDVFRP